MSSPKEIKFLTWNAHALIIHNLPLGIFELHYSKHCVCILKVGTPDCCLGVSNILLLGLGDGYMGVVILYLFIKLYNDDLCIFLCRCYDSASKEKANPGRGVFKRTWQL